VSFSKEKNDYCAPVAQGIEHSAPDAGAQVRVLPGAPSVFRHVAGCDVKVQAFVGDKEINLNAFVQTYVGNVFSGVADSLRGVKVPQCLEFAVDRGSVAVSADGVPIELKGFAAQIVNDTITAVLKHLKGFSPDGPVRIVIES
jgi:hypothetical protein